MVEGGEWKMRGKVKQIKQTSGGWSELVSDDHHELGRPLKGRPLKVSINGCEVQPLQ